MKIYALTLNTEGPGGHGTPGTPYLCIATDGEMYELGDPLPVFSTYEAAEKANEMFDKYLRYSITELTVNP